MANETLRAQVYSVDDDTSTAATDEPHVVDYSLKDTDTPLWVAEWDDDECIVTWSSGFDSPTPDITGRGKIASLIRDTLETTGFRQETWDIPIDMTFDPAVPGVCPQATKFGDTEHLVLGGSGAMHTYSVTNDFALEDPTTTRDYGWEDPGAGTFSPVKPYNTVGANDDGYDSGSAVMLSDGRVMYVWCDNATQGDSIKVAYAADATTFLTTDNSLTGTTTLIDNLTSASSTVFRNTANGNIYLIWSTDGPTVSALTYDASITCTSPADGSTLEGPWTLIFKSEDEGTSWDYYATIQQPGVVRNDWSYSWKSDSDFDSLIYSTDPFVIATSATVNDYSVSWPGRNIAQPYIDGNTWTMPGISYTWYQDGGDTFIKDAGPTLWRSTDNGITWTSLFSYDTKPRYTSLGAPYDGGNSRNYCYFNGYGWWATHGPTQSLGGSDYMHVFNGATPYAGCYAYDGGTNPAPTTDDQYPTSFSAITATDNTDTQCMYVVYPDLRNATSTGRYLFVSKKTAAFAGAGSGGNPFTTVLGGDATGIISNASTTRYRFDTANRQGLILQAIGSDLAMISNGQVFPVAIDATVRDIVRAFIIDRCSSESIW